MEKKTEFNDKTIVFILPSTHAGGGNRVTITLLNGLARRGFTVKLYVYSDENDTRYRIEDCVEVRRWGEDGKSKFLRIAGLFKIIRYVNLRHKNDVIFITDQFTALFSNMFSSPCIYRYVQADDYNFYDDLQILKYKLFLVGYKLFTRVAFKYKKINFIFVSKFVRDQYVRYGGTRRKWRKLNPPIASGFSNMDVRSSDECNICIVARNHAGKGFSDFVLAYKQMKKKDGINNVYVLSPDDLSKYDTDGMTIIHAKNDSEMNGIYNKSHIFVSTTWNEGFGLPALEAMKTGCACAICDNGGTKEYAKDQKNCRLYKGKDSRMLAEILDELATDRNLRGKLASEGSRTAAGFDEDSFVEEFIRFLRNDTK